MRNCILGLLAVSSLGLAGCANDPASQPPVELKPGLYEFSVGGAVGPINAMERSDRTMCVRPRHVQHFPNTLAEKAFVFHGSCQPNRSPRVGNAVSGEVTCPVDPKMAAGHTRMSYSGVVTEDGVQITARVSVDAQYNENALRDGEKIQLEMAMKAMEQVRPRVTARRIGICA